MIRGINHVTLSVLDMDKSLLFYTDILECKLLARWAKGAYLSAGDLWICLMLDSKTRAAPLPEYTHVAFDVRKEDFAAAVTKIKNSGTEIWQGNSSEGDSLYFLDPNGHRLEIHASTLQDRLAACRKSPYADMKFFD